MKKNDKHFPTNHNIFWIHGLTNFMPNSKKYLKICNFKSLKTFKPIKTFWVCGLTNFMLTPPI
jgi:hypothetical protein